jgi:hypothetical protein
VGEVEVAGEADLALHGLVHRHPEIVEDGRAGGEEGDEARGGGEPARLPAGRRQPVERRRREQRAQSDQPGPHEHQAQQGADGPVDPEGLLVRAGGKKRVGRHDLPRLAVPRPEEGEAGLALGLGVLEEDRVSTRLQPDGAPRRACPGALHHAHAVHEERDAPGGGREEAVLAAGGDLQVPRPADAHRPGPDLPARSLQRQGADVGVHRDQGRLAPPPVVRVVGAFQAHEAGDDGALERDVEGGDDPERDRRRHEHPDRPGPWARSPRGEGRRLAYHARPRGA